MTMTAGSDCKRNTEEREIKEMILAAQKQALRANLIKKMRDEQDCLTKM